MFLLCSYYHVIFIVIAIIITVKSINYININLAVDYTGC